jgi:endo-1,4-beta-xylanase
MIGEILQAMADGLNQRPLDRDVTIKFAFDGAETVRLVVTDGHARLEQGDGQADATLWASAEDAAQLFSGQFDSLKAFMSGKLRVEGDLQALMLLQRVMPESESQVARTVRGQRVPYIAPPNSPSLKHWKKKLAVRFGNQIPLLKRVADALGFYVGAAVGSPESEEAQALLPTHFNMVGAENAFKWGAMSPKVGDYDFSLTDAFVEYAAGHGLRLRGHVLIWGRAGKPSDLEQVIRADADPAAKARELMRTHIKTAAGRYRGKVQVWDVVNEPLSYGGKGLDDNIFTQTVGEGYVGEAFRLAREIDPGAELVLNEQIPAGQYAGGQAARGLLALLEKLLDDGVPIDGVGLQSHLLMGLPDYDAFQRYLESIADMGLFIELTEVDARLGLFAEANDPLGAQAALFHQLAARCRAVSAVKGITLWGVSDAVSWLDHIPPFDAGAPNQPLLLDQHGTPKPAYYALAEGLLG